MSALLENSLSAVFPLAHFTLTMVYRDPWMGPVRVNRHTSSTDAVTAESQFSLKDFLF